MKNLLRLSVFIGLWLISLNTAAQDVIRQQPCMSPAILQQADSMKLLLAKQGFMVVKEASMQMVSEYEMPVIVPLSEGSWYQFVFIGDMSCLPEKIMGRCGWQCDQLLLHSSVFGVSHDKTCSDK
jgi:hypothetical protein